MNRRTVLGGTGALLGSAVLARAQPAEGGPYHVDVEIAPGEDRDEVLFRVTLQNGDAPPLRLINGVGKVGTRTQVRAGVQGPELEPVDILFEFEVDEAGERAQFSSTLTDGARLVAVHRSSVSLPSR